MAKVNFPQQNPRVALPFILSSKKELRFSAPRSRSALKQHLSCAGKKTRASFKLRPPLSRNEPSIMERDGDIITKVKSLELCTFTDNDAIQLTSPDAPHSHFIDDVIFALFESFSAAPSRCVWNTPVERPEWNCEFRFSREWWLSFRLLPSTVRAKEYYAPLIPWNMRNSETENQFFADLAFHMRKERAFCSLLHLDHIELTPERMSVLLFDGILKNETRALECFSASFCGIGAATLLLLLCGFNQCRSAQPQLRFLNLPYNWIDFSCLQMLALLLHSTSIRRLCLRGNRLGGCDTTGFQEFLLQGCAFLQELDLGYTYLTLADVCALIRCLPKLSSLEVLLLDGVDIPENRVFALSTAISKSNLTYVSLKGIPACSGTAYLEGVRRACQRNLAGQKTRRDSFFVKSFSEARSFFEDVTFRHSGPVCSTDSALPSSYRQFTTNEPSLEPPTDE